MRSWADPGGVLIENDEGRLRPSLFVCLRDEIKKGKTLEEAYQLTDEDITNALGGLPEYKLHCSVLGADALKQAVENYYYSREQQSI